jgi:hypothetical protein
LTPAHPIVIPPSEPGVPAHPIVVPPGPDGVPVPPIAPIPGPGGKFVAYWTPSYGWVLVPADGPIDPNAPVVTPH